MMAVDITTLTTTESRCTGTTACGSRFPQIFQIVFVL